MAKRKRTAQRSGGQLNRTETVTVRLDPKLNYLCELAARSQRRTKSSLIEAALSDILSLVPVDPRPSDEPRASIASCAELLWHVDEIERLMRLAHYAPHLMTFDEQKIWATLARNGYFWYGRWEYYGTNQGVFRPEISPEKLISWRVEQHWDEIKAVAAGQEPETSLPQALYSFPWDDQMEDATMAPPAATSKEEGAANG